jgi:hypothetical protein
MKHIPEKSYEATDSVVKQAINRQVKTLRCLTKHHSMKTYGGIEAYLGTRR